jgi:hypothetical protein
MLSALLRFVPYIGSFIAAGLPIALAAAVEPGWSTAIWTAALYIVVELLVSQAVEPMLYVALKGLQLAANDAQRGVLRKEQLERVKNAIRELVSELAVHDDREPAPEKSDEEAAAPPPDEREMPKAPPHNGYEREHEEFAPAWRTEAPVLCLAGKGPLDEAASAMLAQLLSKHGLGARIVPTRQPPAKRPLRSTCPGS